MSKLYKKDSLATEYTEGTERKKENIFSFIKKEKSNFRIRKLLAECIQNTERNFLKAKSIFFFPSVNSVTSVAKSLFAVLVLLFAGNVYAAPPAQPMVIHGEVLAEGKVLPEGTELKISVKGQEISLKTANTAEGLSIYTLKIHAYNPDKPEKPGEARAKEGDEIRFLSLGKYTLAQMPSLKWKQGLIVKKDLLVNQVLQKSPSIISASAVQTGEKWSLKCKVGPLQQEKTDSSLISYRIKWFYKKTKDAEQAAADRRKGDEVVLVKEETLKDVKADRESEITYDGPTKDMKYFEVVVTPEMIPDGAKGPSAVKNVFPVVTQGGI